MADKDSKLYKHKELAEILVKHEGIHEGHWGIYVAFGLGAANIPTSDQQGDITVKPAALVSIDAIGIRKFDSPNPLTVDAADVNPEAGT